MKQTIWLALAILALLLPACKGKQPETTADQTVAPDTVVPQRHFEYGVDVTDLVPTDGTIANGSIITTILRNEGATEADIRNILLLPDSIFNTRAIKAGNRYIAYHTADSTHKLLYWVYAHSVKEFSVLRFDTAISVSSYQKPVDRISRSSTFTIESSLWNAIDKSNLNISLALQLSDIFAWTVDFFGLQPNDVFKVHYDELYVDSLSIGIDSIRVASFTRDTATLYAIYYANNEVKGYWEPDGDNIKKAFLKAPLSFSRISSGFSYARRHPVHKTVRPHTGVDYAAPSGTPVMSIGDGVVIERGYKGGGGNTVKIRHNSTYTTAYLHLKGFAKGISVGTRVTQGQVIGYVGSTGTSTGPHLDFRIWKNNTPINPLTMEAPPTEPIPQHYRAQFDSVATRLINLIDNDIPDSIPQQL